MRQLRVAALATLTLVVALSLAACDDGYFADGFGVTATAPATAAPTPAPTTAAPRPTPTPTPTENLGGWVECPRIVTDLNSNSADPATYKQVRGSAFPVQEVGGGTLADACVVKVTTGGESVYWAVLPGDASLAATIKGNLIDAGFSAGSVAGTLTDAATSEGALVADFPDGAALESFLVGPRGFARLHTPLVYVGSFFLS